MAIANPPENGLDQRGYVRPGGGHTVCSIGAYEADAIPPPPRVGDCNGVVAIDELILGVNIGLGLQPVDACPAFATSEGMVDIAQPIQGVNKALVRLRGRVIARRPIPGVAGNIAGLPWWARGGGRARVANTVAGRAVCRTVTTAAVWNAGARQRLQRQSVGRRE